MFDIMYRLSKNDVCGLTLSLCLIYISSIIPISTVIGEERGGEVLTKFCMKSSLLQVNDKKIMKKLSQGLLARIVCSSLSQTNYSMIVG